MRSCISAAPTVAQIAGLTRQRFASLSAFAVGAAVLALTVSSPAHAQSCGEVAAEISNGMSASQASYDQNARAIKTRYTTKIQTEEAAAKQRYAAQVAASPAQQKPLLTQLNAELARIRGQWDLMRQEIKPLKDQNDARKSMLRSYRVQANSAKCTPAHAVAIMQGVVQALSTH